MILRCATAAQGMRLFEWYSLPSVKVRFEYLQLSLAFFVEQSYDPAYWLSLLYSAQLRPRSLKHSLQLALCAW